SAIGAICAPARTAASAAPAAPNNVRRLTAIMPRPSSRQRHRSDLLLKRGARRDRAIPAVEIGRSRALADELLVAIDHGADRAVALGEFVAGEIFRLAELGVEHVYGLDGLELAGGDRAGVALFRRRADQAPEHRGDRRPHDGELPVHPFLCQSAGLEIGWL